MTEKHVLIKRTHDMLGNQTFDVLQPLKQMVYKISFTYFTYWCRSHHLNHLISEILGQRNTWFEVLSVQLDPANSNLVISNSPLFRTQNHFPWIFPSVIYYWLFRTPAISNNYSFSLQVRNSGVQLNLYIENILTNSKPLQLCKSLLHDCRTSNVWLPSMSITHVCTQLEHAFLSHVYA